jgi:hypothetical protein
VDRGGPRLRLRVLLLPLLRLGVLWI